MAEMISHSDLVKMLSYNKESGVFTWKIRSSYRVKIGQVAGAPIGEYLAVGLHGLRHLSHRLAWFYVHGEWPNGDIDHKDGNKKNNSISNLRLANDSQNAANKKIGKSNTSGFKGINRRANGRWRASIEISNKWYSLGTYGSAEDASAAYFTALRKVHGEFARAA